MELSCKVYVNLPTAVRQCKAQMRNFSRIRCMNITELVIFYMHAHMSIYSYILLGYSCCCIGIFPTTNLLNIWIQIFTFLNHGTRCVIRRRSWMFIPKYSATTLMKLAKSRLLLHTSADLERQTAKQFPYSFNQKWIIRVICTRTANWNAQK